MIIDVDIQISQFKFYPVNKIDKKLNVCFIIIIIVIAYSILSFAIPMQFIVEVSAPPTLMESVDWFVKLTVWRVTALNESTRVKSSPRLRLQVMVTAPTPLKSIPSFCRVDLDSSRVLELVVSPSRQINQLIMYFIYILVGHEFRHCDIRATRTMNHTYNYNGSRKYTVYYYYWLAAGQMVISITWWSRSQDRTPGRYRIEYHNHNHNHKYI